MHSTCSEIRDNFKFVLELYYVTPCSLVSTKVSEEPGVSILRLKDGAAGFT